LFCTKLHDEYFVVVFITFSIVPPLIAECLIIFPPCRSLWQVGAHTSAS
jgi:hypothetical protein